MIQLPMSAVFDAVIGKRSKMKFIFILTTLVPLLETASAICHACLDNLCFTKRKIFEAEHITGQIAIDRSDNTLHLHYKDFGETDRTIVIDLNYDVLTTHSLPIGYSFARAVNQNTGEVYFSDRKGIYTYYSLTQQTAHFMQLRKEIWHMQFKDNLYFSIYQQKGLFYIENGKTKCVLPLSDYVIDDFVIDKYGDIYFTSYFLMYRFKKDDIRAKIFSKYLYALASDIYDNVYFIETNERMLYTLDYSNYTLVEVGMFEKGSQVFAMVFDKLNRIIYVDKTDDKVYLLAPNYARCSLASKGKS